VEFCLSLLRFIEFQGLQEEAEEGIAALGFKAAFLGFLL
jgi:hypothetical protein